MYTSYFEAFNKKVPLTPDEEAQIANYLSVKKLRKKQYLLQEGDVCKHVTFVAKGLLRVYTVDDKGDEKIIQFAPEGWTTADLYSFMSGEPSVYNIDAVEDAELVLVSRDANEELLKSCAKYETFTRLNVTGGYLALQKRLISLLSESPEQRYTRFMSLYPNIAQRVPQHMIASYMGLTPETLSRVRKRLAAAR